MSYDDKKRRGRGERRRGGWDDFGPSMADLGLGGERAPRFGPRAGGLGPRPAGRFAMAPRPPANIVGEGRGKVKFFNRDKGFGFVVRDDGGDDVFLHVSALERAGLDDIAEGQPIRFRLSERNGRISAVDVEIEGERLEVRPRGARPRGPRPEPVTDGVRHDGTVKFFNAVKGFGFIARDGGEDVFVHISAVERAGLTSLAPNQRVTFELETDRRGKPAAVRLALA